MPAAEEPTIVTVAVAAVVVGMTDGSKDVIAAEAADRSNAVRSAQVHSRQGAS